MEGVFACVPLASAIAYEANMTATITAPMEGSPSSSISTTGNLLETKRHLASMESSQARKSRDLSTNTTNSATSNSRRNKCFAFKDKYKVIPGRSFGLLPTQLHEVFLALRCDEFFCEPHPMAGKGSYDCVQLAQVHKS